MTNQLCCVPVEIRSLPTEEDRRVAELARGLAHPARVSIVRLLGGREGCLCGDIVDLLPLAQSTVSQHLKILKETGWIVGEVDGPRVCYCLNRPIPAEFKTLIEKF